jgi:hypothetical protein
MPRIDLGDSVVIWSPRLLEEISFVVCDVDILTLNSARRRDVLKIVKPSGLTWELPR